MEKTVNASVILDVRGLTRSYPSGNGTLTVVKDISFSLAPASTCAIVGPSGSGKTTLIGLCAGLDQPTTGEVRLDGIARIVPRGREHQTGIKLLRDKYPQYRQMKLESRPLIEITIERVVQWQPKFT